MGKYYLLKFKSLLRVLPYLFVSVAVLFSCLIIAFSTALDASNSADGMRFRLAMVCSDEDPYFKAGLDIVQAYDSSRFAIEALQMQEKEAMAALEKGELDAYVVIPDGYIGAAMNGELGELKFVSTTGAAELTSLFKEEITGVVTDIIIACEKGMYGVEHIAAEHGFADKAGSYMGQISLKYVDYLLDRTDTYYIKELGIHDSLGIDGYLFSGITVVILCVMLIPASVCFIGQDMDIQRLLKSKNIGPIAQVLDEFAAFLSILLIPVLSIFGLVIIIKDGLSADVYRLIGVFSFGNIIQILSIILLLAAFAHFMFQLADDLVGGILLYFFVALGLCFISGCMYPLYFFPDTVRKITQFLPQGLGRSIISGCVLGQQQSDLMVVLVGYTIVFLGASCLIRILRLRATKR